MGQRSYKSTKIACYIGYVIQALINNLSPVLFIVYQHKFNISYGELSLLVMINFVSQLLVDIFSVKFVDKIGYRKCIIASHCFTVCGLLLLAILPNIFNNAFLSLAFPTIIAAIGSGLIEVLISPTIESLPTVNKASEMSFLHSFYCWGQLLVVLITTLLLKLFGENYWFIIPLIWLVLPIVNGINFISVPLKDINEENEPVVLKKLFQSKIFIACLLLMMCSGASELAVSQWSSLLAEKSLGISKVTGDIFGACMFALLMGFGRLLYGIFGSKIDINKALAFCTILCFFSYLLTSLSKNPVLSLMGCGICGLSVSIMWPGTFSLTAKLFKNGSTQIFALLAVFGDLGCSFGPWLAGECSNFAEKSASIFMDSLKFGILCASVFPFLMIFILIIMNKKIKNK